MNEHPFINNNETANFSHQPEVQTNFEDINKECCCFNLRKVSRAITQYYDHALDPVGLRITQFTLLVALASTKAKTLTEIAESLVMDRTTLTRNLKPLEKMGLIHTVASVDRRSKAYALTEKGRETFNKALPLWEKAQVNMVNVLGSKRYSSMVKELEHHLDLAQYPRDMG